MLDAQEMKNHSGLSVPLWLLNKVLAERLYENRRYHASIVESNGLISLFTKLDGKRYIPLAQNAGTINDDSSSIGPHP